ncbi:glycosyltransferase [Candidatus Giovannonibacteria bacterium]|nr:glycosyltransferase [Candidatus Giovannonibacteria bacterium]
MKISLIIPAHNEEGYLENCLEGAIRNMEDLFEIIVVDNASTDKTAEVARKFPGVKVVHEASKGLTKARQRGFLEARGEILAYVDADTKMPLGWAKRVREMFEKDSKIVCVSGPYKYYDLSAIGNFLVWFYWHLGMIAYFFTGYMVVGGNFAARKDALQKIGGFDLNVSFYGEDTNIARRLHKVGKVKFKKSLFIPTSARRFHGEGIIVTAARYILNFGSEVLIKRPLTKKYRDIR